MLSIKKFFPLKYRTVYITIALLLVIGGVIAGYLYQMAYASNFQFSQSSVRIYINEETSFEEVCQLLRDSAGCKSLASFRLLAGWMKYPKHIKSGCYAIERDMNNLEVVRMLRNGHQSAVRLTFNNIRTKEELVSRLDDELMLSASDLLYYLNDSAWCSSEGFDTATIKTMFIPNTYEIYWNTSAKAFLARMKREYERFWNETRREKARKMGLSPIEISILASIVEEETAAVDEYPLVAGLYINRLKRGMLLQADPTVKYAVGDFSLRRILYSHLEVDSPYNTYKYTGLPPGPLRIPSIRAIDGVLNYTPHNYLYMCAKEDLSGRHNFARTLAEHSRNARRYQDALNRLHIR